MTTSTIDPTVPATNGALASLPVRSNFAAAYADINNILTVSDPMPNLITSGYTIATSDCGKAIVASGGFYTITLPAVSGFPVGGTIRIKNNDTRGKTLSGFPSDIGTILWPQQVIHVTAEAAGWLITHKPGRWRLTAATTVRINPSTGNDANDGLATGAGAFQTLQGAWDTMAANVDTNNYQLTIQAEDGTYTSGMRAQSMPIGNGLVLLQGNTTTPTNCLVAPSVSSIAFQAIGPVLLNIGGFYLNSANITVGLYSDINSMIQVVGNMNFGTVGGVHIQCSHGYFFINANYTISGNASYHFYSAYTSQIELGNITITVTGTPAFTWFCFAYGASSIYGAGATFSGSATGTRYVSNVNAVIDVSGKGINFFPGNVAGSALNGGLYIS